MRSGRSSIAAALGFATLARTAVAGCPNVCELTVDPATVAPALACVKIEVTSETCDCGVSVSLTNGCTTSVNAIGFTFDSCGPPGANLAQLTQPCPVVEPSMLATKLLRASGTGSKHWALQLQNQGADYTATVAANVTSSGAKGGCAVSTGASTEENRSFGVFIGLLGVLWARSRRSARRRDRGVSP